MALLKKTFTTALLCLLGLIIYPTASVGRSEDCATILSMLINRQYPPRPKVILEDIYDDGLKRTQTEVTRVGPEGTPYSVSYDTTNRGIKELKSGDIAGFGQFRKLYPAELIDVEEFAGKVILDAGSGRGKFVMDLRDKNINAFGLDIRLRGDAAKNPDFFIEADMRNTGFKNKSFDLIYATMTVMSYEIGKNNKLVREILREFKRILKPGGEIRISVVLKHQVEDFERMVKEIDGISLGKQYEMPVWFTGDPAIGLFNEQKDFVYVIKRDK